MTSAPSLARQCFEKWHGLRSTSPCLRQRSECNLFQGLSELVKNQFGRLAGSWREAAANGFSEFGASVLSRAGDGQAQSRDRRVRVLSTLGGFDWNRSYDIFLQDLWLPRNLEILPLPTQFF